VATEHRLPPTSGATVDPGDARGTPWRSSGAHLGVEAIPDRLLARLEAQHRITATATALVRASVAKGP